MLADNYNNIRLAGKFKWTKLKQTNLVNNIKPFFSNVFPINSRKNIQKKNMSEQDSSQKFENSKDQTQQTYSSQSTNEEKQIFKSQISKPKISTIYLNIKSTLSQIYKNKDNITARKKNKEVQHISDFDAQNYMPKDQSNEDPINSQIQQPSKQQNSNKNYSSFSQPKQQAKDVINSQIQTSLQETNQNDYQQKLRECIGVIQTVWKDKQDKSIYLCYATGFLIAPHLVVTCAHCLFHESKNLKCSVATFIPGHRKGNINMESVVKTAKKQDIRFNTPINRQSFSKQPLLQQIAVLYLNKPIEKDIYLQIMHIRDLDIGCDLQICGYPNKSYQQEKDLQKITPERIDLKGTLHSIQNIIINHENMMTKAGNSGSPILHKLYKGKEQEKKQLVKKKDVFGVCGIHTHRGYNKINCGVAFNDDTIKILISFIFDLYQSQKKQNFQKQIQSYFLMPSEQICSLIEQIKKMKMPQSNINFFDSNQIIKPFQIDKSTNATHNLIKQQLKPKSASTNYSSQDKQYYIQEKIQQINPN